MNSTYYDQRLSTFGKFLNLIRYSREYNGSNFMSSFVVKTIR